MRDGMIHELHTLAGYKACELSSLVATSYIPLTVENALLLYNEVLC